MLKCKKTDFYIGCKVVCIIGNGDLPCHPKVIKGKIYTITDIINYAVMVDGVDKILNMSRFIPLKIARFNKLKSMLNSDD